jgi:hypothetical protein
MKEWLLLIGAAALLFMVFWPRTSAGKPLAADGLDAPLLMWNETDHLSVRNLLAGGVHAFGRTDAGKSSSLKALAREILRYGKAPCWCCAPSAASTKIGCRSLPKRSGATTCC